MWTYNSSNGALTRNGILVGTGYSGINGGLNNPKAEDMHNYGPIPRGSWTLSHFFDDRKPDPPDGKPHKGPVVCMVMPDQGTETHGRAGFMIHGDNDEHDGTASHGCIILPRNIREQIATSGDSILQVV